MSLPPLWDYLHFNYWYLGQPYGLDFPKFASNDAYSDRPVSQKLLKQQNSRYY